MLLLLAFGGGALGDVDLPLPLGGNAVFSCLGRLQLATACFVDPHLRHLPTAGGWRKEHYPP